MLQICIQEKVKQSHYRPGQALRVPGGWGTQVSKHLAHEDGKVVSPLQRLPFPPRKYSWYSFLLGAESTPEPLCSWKYCQWKISVTQLEIEHATIRLVAQCLNQLRHRIPLYAGKDWCEFQLAWLKFLVFVYLQVDASVVPEAVMVTFHMTSQWIVHYSFYISSHSSLSYSIGRWKQDPCCNIYWTEDLVSVFQSQKCVEFCLF